MQFILYAICDTVEVIYHKIIKYYQKYQKFYIKIFYTRLKLKMLLHVSA